MTPVGPASGTWERAAGVHPDLGRARGPTCPLGRSTLTSLESCVLRALPLQACTVQDQDGICGSERGSRRQGGDPEALRCLCLGFRSSKGTEPFG